MVGREEIEQRNEPMAFDLLRYVPGATVTQNGQRGSAASLIRGGDSNFNLVQIDGVTISNSFGGAFDFAHIPADWLERIEVVRGPQSAVYGAYANSGAVNLVTRAAPDSPAFDVLAEGGGLRGRRFAAGAGGFASAASGVSAWASN